MKAVRGNKEYTIDESQKKHYIDRGYDIRDGDNAVVAYGRGKTVPYDEYEKAVMENKELKERMSVEYSVHEERMSVENKALKEQTENLLEENRDLRKNAENLLEENRDLRKNAENLLEENRGLRKKIADSQDSDVGSADVSKTKTSGKNKVREETAAEQG